jgi:ribosomal-protein-alanine N-acetyltransferase
MEIETNRFLLKKVERKYIENIFKILSDREVIENLNMKLLKSLDDTSKLLDEYEKGFEKKEKFPFEIIDKNTNEFIGVFLIKLDYYDEDCFEFTVYLDKKYWGNGVYSEVLPYMERFAFNNIKTNNVRGFVKEKNVVSRHVLEKYGYKLEKIFEVENIDGKIYSYLKHKNNNKILFKD